MVKKYLPYIIIAVVFLLAGKFLFGRNGTNTEDRIAELERIATEIRDAQQSTDASIKSIESSIGSISTNTTGLSNNYKRIESGINRLSENDKRITEIVKEFGIRNSELEKLSREYKETTYRFGQVIGRIEEGNKAIKN